MLRGCKLDAKEMLTGRYEKLRNAEEGCQCKGSKEILGM